MDARLDWLWMQAAIGPGSPKSDELLRGFGHPSALRKAKGVGLEPFRLEKAERERLADPSLEAAEKRLEQLKKRGIWLLTPEDERYPSLLRGIPGLPLVLYGLGEMPDLDRFPAVAVAGARRLSRDGREMASLFADKLARGGLAVIAGGAVGTEALAHAAAMDAGGLTVSIQAAGFDLHYPRENDALRERILSSGGALLSEYPPDEPHCPLTRHDFLMCNRLISGMTLGVCMIEAKENSGSLMIARHALDQGRDVFAVAGDVLTWRSPGTDELIKQGARLVNDPAEIVEEYRFRFPDILDPSAATLHGEPSLRKGPPRKGTGRKRKEPEEKVSRPAEPPKEEKLPAPDLSALSPEAGRVYQALGNEPELAGSLAAACGMAAPAVLTALTELEMAGAIRRLPGQLYAKG